MKIILLLFLFLILFYYIKTLCKKEAFDTEYNSITKIKGDYETYSENDKFYPSHKINIKKRDILKKLLKYGDDFFKKHKINYSIFYGTLLGYIRNKKIIPYDHDIDCIVGKESINTFINLANDKNIKNVIFTDEISDFDLDFNSENIYLLLNKSLLTNNGYGSKYNCKGVKSSNLDSCSFRGLIGRFIYKKYYYDLFSYSNNLKNFKKEYDNVFLSGEKNKIAYPSKIEDMSILNKNEIIQGNLEDINISVLNNTLAKKSLKFYYGDDYMKPKKKKEYEK